MSNPDVQLSLDECVEEVLGILTGLELRYDPQYDRYRAIVRALNRALRANALEREWSFYSTIEEIGVAHAGVQDVELRATVRPRIIGDDSVRLCDETGRPIVWAYFLPRDAGEKYGSRRGLWCSVTRQSLHFSRPFQQHEEGLRIQVPVMREPRMFRLPETPEDDTGEVPEVPQAIRDQLVDFDYPDLIVARAAYYYASSDPVMQPRAQTLKDEYTQLYYALNERDDRNTDSPYMNDYNVPIEGNIFDGGFWPSHQPHADERR
jgi:hypothetical protein